MFRVIQRSKFSGLLTMHASTTKTTECKQVFLNTWINVAQLICGDLMQTSNVGSQCRSLKMLIRHDSAKHSSKHGDQFKACHICLGHSEATVSFKWNPASPRNKQMLAVLHRTINCHSGTADQLHPSDALDFLLFEQQCNQLHINTCCRLTRSCCQLTLLAIGELRDAQLIRPTWHKAKCN